MRQVLCFAAVWAACCAGAAAQSEHASWTGILHDAAGHPVVGATLILSNAHEQRTTTTTAGGKFRFADLRVGSYSVAVRRDEQDEQMPLARASVDIKAGDHITLSIELTDAHEIQVQSASEYCRNHRYRRRTPLRPKRCRHASQ